MNSIAFQKIAEALWEEAKCFPIENYRNKKAMISNAYDIVITTFEKIFVEELKKINTEKMKTLESMIKKLDLQEMFCFAKRFGACKEVEKHFIKYPKWAYKYATEILKERWLEAEPVIMKDCKYLTSYIKELIQRRWEAVEPIIMEDPESIYDYAYYVVKGRWTEAEPYIMKSPKWAYFYAANVMDNRWKEAEKYIKEDKYYWRLYRNTLK